MTETKSAKKTCPHCGSTKNGSRVPPHLVSSIFALAAALLFWNGNRNNAAADKAAQTHSSRLKEDVAGYILSPNADASCGSCLSSADKFLAERRAGILREKTSGMELIPGGTYDIGSPEGKGDPDEHPARQVALDAFYMDRTETTIAEYMRFAAESGGNYPEWAQPGGKFELETGKDGYYKRLAKMLKTCPDCPVIGVSARNAAAYCGSLNKRLPTEAEWEAAARGGGNSSFSFGDDVSAAGDHAWYEDNSGDEPHPVGRKTANAYGLHDMHGNVWEWTSDFYDASYYSVGPKRNPQGPETGKERVIRGGSWAFDMDSARAANRASSDKPNDDIGFRCAVPESAAGSVIARK